MTGLALLSVLWIAGIVVYFCLTTERQREQFLLAAWIAMLAPAVFFLIMGLTR